MTNRIMAYLSTVAIAIALGMVTVASAQTWQNQVNTSICNWSSLRANVVRDTIYLDGGDLWWQRGFSDGRLAPPNNDGNPSGILFQLPFTTPFDTSKTNLTSLFGRMSITGSAANNIGPNYQNGVMFASDNAFITYGGLLRVTDSQPYPPDSQTLTYERHQWGPARINWEKGFVVSQTNNDVTRYITHGAGVSVPSDDMGYYFSGMHGKNWGEIRLLKLLANVTSDRLISVDQSQMRGETKWSNSSIPDDIPGRANGELVWLPVSKSGVLVAVGGVKNPISIFKELSKKQETENNKTGPAFMEQVPIYDISSKKWYMQNTTGDTPPPLSEFCSVVASAKDGSSHNIYIYGGYSGSVEGELPSDDAYILSVPSFKWVKAHSGEKNHGRRGHRCMKAYPDQMFVVGGRNTDPSLCIDVIRVFNLNTLKFQNAYDPEKWNEYKVPKVVIDEIGGDENGEAETTKPKSWGDKDLEGIFAAKYDKKIKTWYPYKSKAAPSQTPDSDSSKGGGGGLPKWVAPVLGVVLGLIFVTGLAVLWLLWRRRRERRYAPSLGATSDSRNRILRWMIGTGPPAKASEVTATSTEVGPPPEKHRSYSEVGSESVASPRTRSTAIYSDLNEAASSPVHEMQGTAATATMTAPLELPTEFNETSASPRARYPSDASSFLSPVSPPVSPAPESQMGDGDPVRPTHNRHNSSLSSTGFPLSLNQAVASDEPDLQRPRYVSGFHEDIESPRSETTEQNPEPEVKTW